MRLQLIPVDTLIGWLWERNGWRKGVALVVLLCIPRWLRKDERDA